MTTARRLLEQRIAEELRAELGRQDKSRRWLAAATDIPLGTLARYIKGTHSPGLNDLDSICRALGISIPDLLEKVERNGGYDPKCAIGDSNAEPADSEQEFPCVVDGLWPERTRRFWSVNLRRNGLRSVVFA